MKENNKKHEIVYRDPRELIAYENNSRVHSADQIDRIKRSIEEFGFINPVLIDENNTIIAGHARTESAIDLGLSEVPTISVEHLTEEQIKAYVIADNRLAELSSWDNEMLKFELDWLKDNDFDIDLTGFDGITFEDDEDEEINLVEEEYVEAYNVVIECRDEVEQESIYNEMTERGLKCRVQSL